MSLYSFFIEPFAYEFMRNALFISILAGTVAPLTVIGHLVAEWFI